MAWSIFQQGGGDAGAEAWAVAFLERLGIKPTPADTQFVYDWEKSEGGGGAYNPLNQGPVPGHPELTTTGPQYGGGAADYASYQAGLTGAVDYLHMTNYTALLSDLQRNDPAAAAQDLWRSPWATGHYGYGSEWSDAPLPGQPSAYSVQAAKLGNQPPGSGPANAMTGAGGAAGPPASSAAPTTAVLERKNWNALGYLAPFLDPGAGLAFGGAGGIGDIAGNLAGLAKSVTSFTNAILYGGTWIRFGEAWLGLLALTGGAALLVATLASSPGGLSAVGTVAALIPGEGQAGRLAAGLVAGARSAGGTPAPAARAVAGARSHSQARRQAAERHRAATAGRVQQEYRRSLNTYEKARARDAKRAQADADEQEYERTAPAKQGRENRKGYRRTMSHFGDDTSDIRRRTA